MDFNDLTLKIILSAAATVYTIIFGIVAKKVWDVPDQIQTKLTIFEASFKKTLDRLDDESKLAHRRINVHDRISSNITRVDFDSRAIAETGAYPDLRGQHET